MATTDFRQHLEVETPEHVVLDYEIAGLGSRALAAIVDHVLLTLWLIAVAVLLARLGGFGGAEWLQVLMVFVVFLSYWGYFTFFEALRAGQTPGKRWLGIRVVQDTGHAVTMGSAVARNLLRIADFLPPPYLIGALFVALHPRGKRLGDLVAGTVVVRDRPGEATLPAPATDLPREEPTGVPELADEEFHFLREFAERAPQLQPEVRARVAHRLTERLGARYPNRAPDPELFLTTLYQDELARRRGRFASRSAATGTAAGTGRGVADRLVARKSARWDEFAAMAGRAAKAGLDSFDAAELPDFAARYREVAADLARARTYRAAPPVLERLERLVAAGHNLLYRDERHTGQQIWRFLARDCPAGIVEAHRAVVLAFLMFTLPAAGGYLLLRERPGLAQEVIPEVMLERAEAGRARQQQGKGYVEAELSRRPFMASSIMTNNIQVAFSCFAGGIFAGVGSLVLLAYNGLSIGSISGYFANQGLLGYLWTFVIGHGVLELFAIWVAGAAGFLLGKALIAPGDLSRAEALTLAGRLALRMIGAVVVLLVIAGLIEGFVSAGTSPLPWRIGVSVASLLFLLAYLGNGWVWLRTRAR
ncbi:MAG TPA: stage II sporulation protein M [Gemmatimonadales bacterium]|nr:stage II sporulation protein M [Gemmatimonadales bacterium]